MMNVFGSLMVCLSTALASQLTIDPASVLRTGAEVGLTPEAVAAAGLQNSASTLLSQLFEADELCQQIINQRQSLDSTTSNLAELEAALMHDPLDETIRGQYDAVVAAANSLRAQIETSQVTLFDAITVGLSETNKQKLANLRDSQLRHVPVAFGIKPRTAEQWGAIERALIAERRAQRLGTQLNPAHAELLASIRADFDVIEASLNLQNSLPNLEAAFAQAALGPQ